MSNKYYLLTYLLHTTLILLFRFLTLNGFYFVSFILDYCFSVLVSRARLGWLGFNGTISINRPYRAIKKIKVC